MYEEKEQLQKRIERSKSRVQDRGNSASHLSLATQFRLLAEKQNDLLLRQEEQRNAVSLYTLCHYCILLITITFPGH